ncbi:outer membrane protein assembly factor BamE [Buchnera aphidicola]|uniref:Outer membrane protein assembly factor BamE n=1 Tax=Buchnera aphidicola (Aphis nerii) TaxID=1241835 RepID=A0A4D6XNV8_9GAMM|nr:outer membrane protein assembly factor BamE [Buchnera aphidicola]QCI18743.1 outer membrane protein assembly factor BamE [Buchnera aphidicola (Aphis nerii)]
MSYYYDFFGKNLCKLLGNNLLMNIQISKIKILLITLLLTSCSFLGNKNYNYRMNEFCLNLDEFKKNYKDMTREQIIYVFGSPIISDSFSDSYHYVFFEQSKKNICKKVTLNIFFKKNKVFYFNIE